MGRPCGSGWRLRYLPLESFLPPIESAACRAGETLYNRRMNFRSLALSLALFFPTGAFAHPGHASTALHLHAGVPTAGNALDVWILAAALVGMMASVMRPSR